MPVATPIPANDFAYPSGPVGVPTKRGVVALQSSSELAWLFQNVVLPFGPGRILEIGVHHGGLALLWLRTARTVVGVDVAPRPACLETERYRHIQGNSTDPAIVARVRKCGPFDLVFVDGGHDSATVSMDSENYLAMLRPGGLAIWHDVRWYAPLGCMDWWLSGNRRRRFPGAIAAWEHPCERGYGLWINHQNAT